MGLLERMAADRDKRRRYASGTTAWRKGFIKSPTLRGLWGEWAVAQFLRGCGVVWKPQFVANADPGWDIELPGCEMKLDVKTLKPGGALLVKRINESDHPYAASQIRATVPGVDFIWCEEHLEHLDILGWLVYDEVFDGRLIKSRVAHSDHWNIQIDRQALRPMSRLRVLAAGVRVKC